MRQRYRKQSRFKALALLLSLALALAFLIYWQREPILTILYLLGFALA